MRRTCVPHVQLSIRHCAVQDWQSTARVRAHGALNSDEHNRFTRGNRSHLPPAPPRGAVSAGGTLGAGHPASRSRNSHSSDVVDRVGICTSSEQSQRRCPR